MKSKLKPASKQETEQNKPDNLKARFAINSDLINRLLPPSEKIQERPKINEQDKNVSSTPNERDVQKAIAKLREYADILERIGAGKYAKGRIQEVRDSVYCLYPLLVATLDVGNTISRKKTKLNDVEYDTKNLMTDCLVDLDNIGKVPVQESIKILRAKANELEQLWGIVIKNQTGIPGRPKPVKQANSQSSSETDTRTKMSLREFIEKRTDAELGVIDSKIKRIKAVNKKEQLLPKTANNPKGNETKLYYEDALHKVWPKLKDKIPTLPNIKK